MLSPGTIITSRSTQLRSSRTLPGQGWAASAASAAGVKRFGAERGAGRRSRQEVLGEQRDVPAALAQRRHVQRDHREPVEEVLAEAPGGDQVLEVAVGGGDHPHVDAHRLAAADPLEALALEHPQQLGLRARAACRRSRRGTACRRRPARTCRGAVDRAGEGAALVAEELALDESSGQRGAVDLDERPRRRGAVHVDRARHQLLAGAALAGDQDPARARRRRARRGGAARRSPGPPRRSRPRDSAWRSSSLFSRARRRSSRAWRSTSSVFSSESGFSMKSYAPSLVVRTAVSMVPWPDIMTTGRPASP